MPTITLNKKDFESLVGRKLPLLQLKQNLAMLGTNLESIKENEITIEIFPNRPDMLSEEGLARALSSFINCKTGLKKYRIHKSNYKCIIEKKTEKVRPYVAYAVVKNIKFTEASLISIMQLQEKLHLTFGRNRKKLSIGIYDLDKIKFPLTYTTKPHSFKFTPLESTKSLTLSQILKQHEKGIEYSHLIKGFKEYPIWIDSDNLVLSMPPIINSDQTKVTKKTKNLFVDVTGLDKNAVEQALNIMICALSDRGGKIYEVKSKKQSYPNLTPKKLKLNLDHVNKILGLNLKENDIKKLLEKMGYDYKNKTVYIPAYRSDILHEIDVIEDIAIAYGYDNFKSKIPSLATIGSENSFEKLKTKIAEVLIGHGFIETSSYTLTSKEILDKMNINLNYIETENAKSKDYTILRPWLIPSLLEILYKNKHNEYPQKIFEINTVFKKEREVIRLACLITHEKTNFTEIKQIFDSLMQQLNLKYEMKEVKHNSFIEGRVGRISIKGKEIAYIGEIHPAVLTNFNLNLPVSAFEFNLTDLSKLL